MTKQTRNSKMKEKLEEYDNKQSIIESIDAAQTQNAQ